jgi:hypothetical protein
MDFLLLSDPISCGALVILTVHHIPLAALRAYIVARARMGIAISIVIFHHRYVRCLTQVNDLLAIVSFLKAFVAHPSMDHLIA